MHIISSFECKWVGERFMYKIYILPLHNDLYTLFWEDEGKIPFSEKLHTCTRICIYVVLNPWFPSGMPKQIKHIVQTGLYTIHT